MWVAASSLTVNASGTADYSIGLRGSDSPANNVTVAVTSSDASKATVSGSLTFITPSNWKELQQVTVTGEASTFGCQANHPDANCKVTAVLSGDDFTIDETDCEVVKLWEAHGNLVFGLNKEIPQRVRGGTLNAGSTALNFAGATCSDSDATAIWDTEEVLGTALSWPDGTSVDLHLIAPEVGGL